MRVLLRSFGLIEIAWLAGSCSAGNVSFSPNLETSFSFLNLSKRFYATIRLREHRPGDPRAEYFEGVPLQPPGGIYRLGFRPAVGVGCPGAIDVQIFLYRRIHEELPIGSDANEEIQQTPIVAGEILNVPVCSVQPLETFTIFNWEACEGTAKVRFGQCNGPHDAESERRFQNTDFVWITTSADMPAALANAAPPPMAAAAPLRGIVTMADGSPAADVGVVLRSRFRVRAGEQLCNPPREPDDPPFCHSIAGADVEFDPCDPDSPPIGPDAGYGLPFLFTVTNEEGMFILDRPIGVYEVEIFSTIDDAGVEEDDGQLKFRPCRIEVESPSSEIHFIAERSEES